MFPERRPQLIPTPPPECERRAIQQAQRGGAEGFEFLYDRHKQRVYSLCLRMTGNPAEAEDLAQEAFLQLFRKIGTFRGESAFSTWLHRLAVNVALMRLRRKQLPQAPLQECFDAGQTPTPQHALGAFDQSLVGAIDRIFLDRALSQLAPEHHAVVMLHDVAGYNHREIAAALGCSHGASRVHLHRAHIKLRRILQPPIPSAPASRQCDSPDRQPLQEIP